MRPGTSVSSLANDVSGTHWKVEMKVRLDWTNRTCLLGLNSSNKQ